MKILFLVVGLFFVAVIAKASEPAKLYIELTQPKIDEQPYHRPYVAVWLETLKRKGLTTIDLWYGRRADDDKWLKDLRQWWRKLGRKASKSELDAMSGATRRSGVHKITWNGEDDKGIPIPDGDYFLNIEASREDGGRDYIRQKITLGQAARIEISAKPEIGPIVLEIK